MRCLLILVISLIIHYSKSDNFRQEAAKVMYTNPKYVKEVTVFTYRHTRQSPYVTSCNGTILHSWYNNVSLSVTGYSAKLKTEIFSLEFKACDILKVPWAKSWLKEYSNVPLVCPVAEATYNFKEIAIPPKNFPIPLPAGDYGANLIFFITDSKEKILDIKMNLRFENKKLG